MSQHDDDERSERDRDTDAAAAAAAGDEAGPTPGTDDQVDALTAERDRLHEQLQRSLADLANIRRRQAKEKQDARESAVEAMARELLPVLDNFQLALDAHAHSAGDPVSAAGSLVEGLRMVRGLLEGVLERHGVREIPALGEPFDPNVHEAVGVDPQAEVAPGAVARVLQRGFTLGDRVLRASRVMVRPQAEGGAPARDDEPGDDGPAPQ